MEFIMEKKELGIEDILEAVMMLSTHMDEQFQVAHDERKEMRQDIDTLRQDG